MKNYIKLHIMKKILLILMIAVSYAGTSQETKLNFNTMTQFFYNKGTTEYDFVGETVTSDITVSINKVEESITFLMKYEGDDYLMLMQNARVNDVFNKEGVEFIHVIGYVQGSKSEVFISKYRVELFLHRNGIAYLLYNTQVKREKI